MHFEMWIKISDPQLVLNDNDVSECLLNLYHNLEMKVDLVVYLQDNNSLFGAAEEITQLDSGRQRSRLTHFTKEKFRLTLSTSSAIQMPRYFAEMGQICIVSTLSPL